MSRKHFKRLDSDNMKTIGLNVYVFDFSADYDAIEVNDTLDIHKYLMKKNNIIRFIIKVFVVAMSFFSCNALKCVSMNNQECKVRPEIININSNEPSFYPYSVKISKCSSSCNNINNPYAKLFVPYVSKNMNVKVFNLISRTNETRYIKWLETRKCKCRLDASVCNNKQRWDEDKCRCEYKLLIDKGICDKGFRQILVDKCRQSLVDKLVEECNENIDKKNYIQIK